MNTLLDSVSKFVPSFVPNEVTNYTLRYIFYRKSDLASGQRNACFRLVTDLWQGHEALFERLNFDDDISSCFVEYVCEYDTAFAGVCALVKEKKEDTENA